MENLDSQLIRKYITLVENVEKSIENGVINTKKPLDEQMSLFNDALKSLANTVKAEPALFQQLKNETNIISKYKINNIDDLIKLLNDGKVANSEAGTIVKNILKNPGSKELAIKIKGLISAEPGFIEIAKKVYPKGTQMPFNQKNMDIAKNTLKQLGIEEKVAEDMLKTAYQKSLNVSGKNITKIGKDPVKVGKDAGKVGKDAGKVGKEGTAIADDVAREIETGIKTTNETKNIFIFIKDYIKEIKVTIINNIRTFIIPNKLLAWLLVGGGLIVLYNLLKGSGGEIVIKDENDKIIDPNKLEGWAQCMKNLIKNNQGELTKSSKGNPVVKVTKTGNSEYDALGGLLFFTDYTVLSMDGRSKKGKWKCKSGQVQTIDEKYLNEQATNNITNDVSVMIDLLDFPVTKNDLVQANNLLQKYVTNGQGKEFLNLYNDSGLANASLETSLNYIATFDPASVQAKNQMYDKIKQIKTGKGGQGKPTNTGDPLSGIEITWDDGKPTPTQKPIPENNYRDCNNFPLFFGCKGKLVSDLQTCLKMTSTDGKFGPATKAAAESWAKSNNITLKAPINAPGGGVYETFGVTEENFKKICGGTEPIKPTPTPNVQDPLTPTPTPNVQDPLTPTPTPNVQEPTPTDNDAISIQKLLERLKRNNQLVDTSRNRTVYRGPDLTPEEQSLLIKHMKGSGFEPKNPNKAVREWRRGDKIVFKRTGSYGEE
jgi:hypothetical protein